MAHQPPHAPVSPVAANAVRRHHTISSSSRAARSAARVDDDHTAWDPDDDYVGDEWVGNVAPVGEKNAALHRQTSLPSKYGRAGFRHAQGPPASGALTPSRTVNSLSVIQAAHGIDGEAEEEEWEHEREMMRGWMHGEDDDTSAAHEVANAQASHSPLSPQFHLPNNAAPSPPPAASGVRRHQSLTHTTARQQPATSLKRAGTASGKAGRSARVYEHSPSPPSDPEEELQEEGPLESDQPQFQPQAFATSPATRSPWSATSPKAEWRTNNSSRVSGSSAIDDVQRALSQLDVNAQAPLRPPQTPPHPSHASPPTQQAPRFSMPYASPLQVSVQLQQQQQIHAQTAAAALNARKLQLVTDLQQQQQQSPPAGPASASAFIPPIGHPVHAPPTRSGATSRNDDRALTASGAWDQKDRVLGTRTSNGSLNYNYNAQYPQGMGNVPPMPAIPPQYLSQTNGPRLGVMTGFGGAGQPSPQQHAGMGSAQLSGGPVAQGMSPIDVPSLIASKGYNPTSFDIRPEFARYFVIKSYTEDDVHKSLKYEIWSSTDPGNKRLDKAFKETAGRGPIYLFFSVNGSGHFCGVAEMLTPVDYTRSSTVWASDKWKGVFKVRWIFVRDVPNASLRHIRLNNTQERKPVTNSRDTQELLPDAGQEMLRICFTHPARTSLLQDFAFYELQSLQRLTGQPSPSPSPQPGQMQHHTPSQVNFGIGAQQAMGYTPQHLQMPPIMAMQLGAPYSHPHAMQSVMRHPSPIPGQVYGTGPQSNAF